MFESNLLDQFSLLDDFPSVTPVWHPFVQHVTRESAAVDELDSNGITH